MLPYFVKMWLTRSCKHTFPFTLYRNIVHYNVYALIIFLFLFVRAKAQDQKPVNLNEQNGLPTSFIYDMTVDKYGYLWLGTPKGVVKYNGYETKTFNFASGLPNEDIWSVFADDKGRLWCGTHSNRIAYIKNDRVVLVTNAGFNTGLYPRHIQNFKGGIAFADLRKFYYERNDTLHLVKTGGSFADFVVDDNFYSIHGKDTIVKIKDIDSPYPRETVLKNKVDNQLLSRTEGLFPTSLGKDYIHYFPTADTIWITSADSNFSLNYNYFFNRKPQIISVFEKGKWYMVRYDQGMVILNKQYKAVNIIRFDKSFLNGADGNKIPVAFQDALWDTCIATNAGGLYILHNQQPVFRHVSEELKDYRLVKTLSNGAAIWWNTSTHKGILLQNSTIKDSFRIPQYQVQAVAETDSTRLYIFTSAFGYWYTPGSSTLVSSASMRDAYIYSEAFDGHRKYSYSLKDIYLRRAVVKEPFGQGGLLGTRTDISDLRYKEVLYDAHYDINIVYKYDRIVVIKNDRYYHLNASFLGKLGIHNIECIRTDNKGNIFIKDNEQVACFNIDRMLRKTLFTHANFVDGQMVLKDSLLVIGGGFGIGFYKIDSALNFPHHIYRNIKSVYYNQLYYLQINDSDVFFTGNTGCFTIPLPAEREFSLSKQDDIPYRLVIRYNDTNYLAGGADTLKMTQDNLMLDLDVINPSGNGKPVYSYCTGQDWKTLSSNQLFLTGMEAGLYTTLNIVAKDKDWVSGKNVFVVYIVPHWWQTNLGKGLIALGIVLFIALVVLTAYLVTRAAIKKRTERNQLRMDIELKAIYSQINPHFIFNTLSGTQYFIRENQTQQARLHLNKFSRLLRSYIHSSRNKYISIKDELSNLVNYIELQQIRFTDKFDYKINIADGLPIELIKIPSLLLQPLVENAINHGLFHIEGYKGLLSIQFSRNRDTDEIVCIIDDTGIGRLRAKEIKADSIVKTESYGDALIKDLINIFNKYEKLNIEIQYIDKQPPETGTTVILKIKNPVYEQ